jgi:peptidoglycan/LPS O-acetylase OafA/YrhL
MDYNRKLKLVLFLKRRLLRVYPAFTASFGMLLLLGWLIRFFVKDNSLLPAFAQPRSFLHVISGYLLQTTEMNASYWSLCLELRWYLLFPFVIFLARRFISRYLVIASLVTCALIPQNFPLHGLLKVPVYLPLLIAGVAVAAIFSRREQPIYQLVFRYAWLGFLVSLGLTFWILPGPFDSGRGTLAEVLPTTGLFSFLILMGLQWKQLNFPGRLLESIGIYSYSLYLVHQPLIEFFRFVLNTDKWTSPWSLGYSLISLPLVAIAFGYCFFLVFEHPFLNMGKGTKQSPLDINVKHE